MTFQELLKDVRDGLEMNQQTFAQRIGYTAQYLSDIENGRRLPSVRITNAICDYLGRGSEGRRIWHSAGARAHGWDVGGEQ